MRFLLFENNIVLWLQVILDKLETYDSFETYLAGDRVVIDLSLTETPMEQLPEALSNISCPSFMVRLLCIINVLLVKCFIGLQQKLKILQ